MAFAVVAPAFLAPDAAASGERLSHDQAAERLAAAGIPFTSTGNCIERENPECTSFEDIYSGTIDGVITLQRASECPIRVTGGTEAGHMAGEHSHGNGYKIDISLGGCVDDYIRSSFVEVPPPSFGTEAYRSAAGNEYVREVDHWDIVYY